MTDTEVSRACLALAQHFQQVFRATAPTAYSADPMLRRPCHTCAMNPGTNGDQGQDRTALAFFASMARRAAGEPARFVCHEALPRDADGCWTRLPVILEQQPDCAGFQVLAGVTATQIQMALADACREVWGFELDADGYRDFISTVIEILA